MPIYEYLCRKCNIIFQFFIRTPGREASPACPKCGGSDMERVMSSFSTSRKASITSSGGDAMPDMSGLDESDPRSMARAIRHMADDMGEDLGPELHEAIARLEAGEDPEQVERELEDAGFGDDEEAGEGGSCTSCGPGRDPGLYEA